MVVQDTNCTNCVCYFLDKYFNCLFCIVCQNHKRKNKNNNTRVDYTNMMSIMLLFTKFEGKRMSKKLI